jgi:hypothetical protein
VAIAMLCRNFKIALLFSEKLTAYAFQKKAALNSTGLLTIFSTMPRNALAEGVSRHIWF